jgi:hypothetical protein
MSIPGIDWDELAHKKGKLKEAEMNALAVAWEHDHTGAFFAVKRYEPCCTGPCNKGQKLCPTPDACIKAMDDFRGKPSKTDLRIGMTMIVVSAIAAVALIVWSVKAVASWL